MKQIIFSLVISFLVSCQESNEFQNQVQSAVALIKRAQEMEIVQPELLTSSLTDEELDIEFMTSPEEEGFINTEENSSYNAESFSSEMTKIILQNLEPEGVLDDFNDLKAEFKNSDIPFTDEKVLMDIAIQSIDARRSYLESFLDKTVDECSESFLEKSKQRLETLKKNKENIESWLSKPKDFSQDFISQKLLKCTESKLTSDNKQIFSDWLKEYGERHRFSAWRGASGDAGLCVGGSRHGNAPCGDTYGAANRHATGAAKGTEGRKILRGLFEVPKRKLAQRGPSVPLWCPRRMVRGRHPDLLLRSPVRWHN